MKGLADNSLILCGASLGHFFMDISAKDITSTSTPSIMLLAVNGLSVTPKAGQLILRPGVPR